MTFDECYKAAKLVASCPRDRLSAVLAILAQSGFDIENIEQILAESQKMRDEPHIYYRRKYNGMRDNWLDTDNEIALMLRKAYDCNVSFTTLSDLCGINRTQLYQYTRGIKTASDITARMIRDSLEKIFADIGA